MTGSIEGKVSETKIETGKNFIKLEREQSWILIEEGIIDQIGLEKLKDKKINYFVSGTRQDNSILYGLIVGEGESKERYQFTKKEVDSKPHLESN